MTRTNRKRSNSTSPNRENIKAPKLIHEDTTVEIMKLIDSKFKELNDAKYSKLDDITTNIESSKATILTKIGAQISDLRREYNDKIQELEIKIKECDGLRMELNVLKEKTEKYDNAAISAELRINGIPSNPTENLFNMFKCICDVLQVPLSPLHMRGISSCAHLRCLGAKIGDS